MIDRDSPLLPCCGFAAYNHSPRACQDYSMAENRSIMTPCNRSRASAVKPLASPNPSKSNAFRMSIMCAAAALLWSREAMLWIIIVHLNDGPNSFFDSVVGHGIGTDEGFAAPELTIWPPTMTKRARLRVFQLSDYTECLKHSKYCAERSIGKPEPNLAAAFCWLLLLSALQRLSVLGDLVSDSTWDYVAARVL